MLLFTYYIIVVVFKTKNIICSSLRDIVNLLASRQAPFSISKFLAGGSLIPLVKNKPICPFDVRPIAVGEPFVVWSCSCVKANSLCSGHCGAAKNG